MEIRQMRYFLAVAETLHFQRAAEMLHLSQPSLSQQIRQIEQEIGAVLFERTNRKVELTLAGTALVPRVRAVLRDLDQTMQEVRRIDQGIVGKLTIGFVSTALVGVLPRAMKELQACSPGIDLQLKESEPQDQLNHLLDGSADIGFMHAQLDDKQLRSVVIQRDHLVAALPEELAPAGPVALRDFMACTSIVPSPFSTFGFHEHVRRAYRSAGGMPIKIIYTNLIISGITLVAAGVGMALVPSSFQTIHIPGVVYRELECEPHSVDLLAVWKAGSRSKLLARFLSILNRNAGLVPATVE
jgi:DNA-binding transcriptional LysR family regulator